MDSETINETGFDKSLVSRYFDILRTLRFVEKEVPVTEKYPEKSKQGIYRLHDRYFTFWFKYIFPNRGRLELGNTDYVLKLIKDSFDLHVSTVYEGVCAELCGTLMAQDLIQYTLIGKWWTKDAEIDIVSLDENSKTAYFGECKWSNNKVGVDIYQDLVRKAGLVDWHKDNRKEKFMLFSRSGFTPEMTKVAKDKGVLLYKDGVIV